MTTKWILQPPHTPNKNQDKWKEKEKDQAAPNFSFEIDRSEKKQKKNE